MFIYQVNKRKIFVLLLVVFSLLFVLSGIYKQLTSASGTPWVQTDWSGGVGASTTTQFSSSSNINYGTNGEIKLTSTENSTNPNFESDISGWNGGIAPTSLSSNLKLWVDSSDISTLFKDDAGTQAVTSNNDNVRKWLDKSGNNYHLTVGGSGNPQYKVNTIGGNPTIFIDQASNGYYFLNSSVLNPGVNFGSGEGSIFIVYRNDTYPANGHFSINKIGADGVGAVDLYNVIGSYPNDFRLDRIGGASYGYPSTGTHIKEVTMDASTGWNLYADGALKGTSNYNWGLGTNFELGANTSHGSSSFTGYIAEALVFNKSLTANERKGIKGYLQAKYGIGTGALTLSRDTGTTYSGSSGSMKLLAGGNGGIASQSINVGNTNQYLLSTYAYTDGSAVTSSDLELYYNGAAISTTFTSVGSGWYRLSGTVTGANASRTYGVQVKANKTVYIDNFSILGYSTTGTLTSNIFDAGLLSDWGNLTYTSSLPAGTTLSVKVRSGNVSNLSDASNFNVCANVNSGSDLSGGCSPDSKRYIQYQLTLSGDGTSTPTFSDITIDNDPSDNIAPHTNASSVVMYRTNGGTLVGSESWTSSLSPKFSWTAGADETAIKGYCLRLVNKSSLDPSFDDTNNTDLTNITFNSSGLINSSNTPVDASGSGCSFIINSTEIDFSNQSYRQNPWIVTSNDLYYLFVKVIDVGNNMFVGPTTFFKFKVDITTPTNVSYISSASGTFGNVNDMNFSWPIVGGTASSDNDSGLLGWQYQINSSVGTWQGTDTDVSLGVNYIPSGYSSFPYFLTSGVDGPNIQIGNNVIYFRTIDVAGNVSSGASLRTANISFGGAAPTFPSTCDNTTGITVDPTVSASNSFSLSWPSATPAPGRTISKYYYMINTQPPATLNTINSNSATYLSSNTTSIASAPLNGVVKGANTVYVVAVDDIDIYSSTNCLKGIFTLNSNLPDPPSSLSVSDASIKSASLWRSSLAWGLPTYKGTGILSYKIERSEDGSSWSNIATTTGNAYLDTIPESKRYYWRVSTMDNTVESQNAPSSSNAVSLIPKGVYTEPPTLTSTPQSLDISTRRAKISWTTSREADSKIAYGTKSGEYIAEEVYNSQKETNHLISLTNLFPSTLYYYVAKWTDEDGNTGTSSELSFRTSEAPNVKDVSVTNISVSSALIKYTSKDASIIKIYFGKTTGFGGLKELPTSPIEAPYTTQLTGLDDGVKYYYKINSLDSDGNEYQGTTLDFTTLPRPRLFDINFSQIRGTAQPSVLVTWKSNTEVSTVVSYYVAGNEKNVKDVTNPNLVKDLNRAVLRELDPETNYAMVIKARDKVGNEVVSDIYQFTTAIDTRPPTISGMKVESVVPAKSGQSTGAQIIVSWNTDKPSTSQVEFGEGTGGNYSQKTQEETTLKQNHLVVISDLTPSKVYSIRALSRDKAGNIGKSSGNNTLTPKAVDSALDIVITILSDAFSFLSGIQSK